MLKMEINQDFNKNHKKRYRKIQETLWKRNIYLDMDRDMDIAYTGIITRQLKKIYFLFSWEVETAVFKDEA